MNQAYVDANVVLRYLTKDPADLAEQARKIFSAAASGKLELILTDVTVAEIVWTLESFYKFARIEIADNLIAFMNATGLEVREKETLLAGLVLYRNYNIDFADALLAAYAQQIGPNLVCSFDHDFRRIRGVNLLEPGAF